nr:MAG TPA: hypothetical protein [Caudoviricetes sp.]
MVILVLGILGVQLYLCPCVPSFFPYFPPQKNMIVDVIENLNSGTAAKTFDLYCSCCSKRMLF